MKRILLYFILAAIALIIAGCRTTKPAASPPVVMHERDSVREEIKTIIVYVPDTVTIEIPAQTAERTTADSVSTLENDFAFSFARINYDGTLFHTLMTKPGKIDIPFDKPVEKTENNRIQIKEIEKPVPVEVPVEVERKLTWWESTCIKFFPYSLGLLLFAVVYAFRKPIINLARRLTDAK